VRTPPAVLVVPGAFLTVLAGCIAPAARSSGALSGHAVNIAAAPAHAIRLRGRCVIAPSQQPIANRTYIVRVAVGECHLTHLGMVRAEVEQQVNVALGTHGTQLTLTTADGAAVWLSAFGDTDGGGDPLRFTGAARVVGGTHRFGSVTGEARTEGVRSSGDRRGGRGEIGVVKIDGWITYQGAERSGAAERGGR